ncbi:endolytic transglycosylase MltG [Streptomyces sp. NPDC059175]|uniref:endolytic transglycosylase MltG n=1 Tax=Streptomyces sp. NPDC059175 TaxID=3346757 RepID=UPI0036B3D58A
MKRQFPKVGRPGGARLTRRGRLVVVAGVVGVVAVAVSLFLPSFREQPRPPKQVTRPKALVIPEGWRSSQVYAAVDTALGLRPGSTRRAAVAHGPHLRLPVVARGNPEGFLFPATYPLDEGTTPAGLLSYMVNTAGHRFGTSPVNAGAQRHGMTLYQAVVVASIVQAEAETVAEMGKVARVIHNRLDQGMPLQMDSTLNYALNRSTLDTTHEDTKIESPYNTYGRRGLPPTPIGNPGEAAMKAAISPPPGDWLYFVTVAPGDTRFTADFDEQRENVDEFNARRRSAAEDSEERTTEE